jgi:hypothetical protein
MKQAETRNACRMRNGYKNAHRTGGSTKNSLKHTVTSQNSHMELDGDELPASSYGQFPPKEIPPNRNASSEENQPYFCGYQTQFPTQVT